MSTITQTRTVADVSTDAESSLPDGWTYATLSDVSEQIRYGYTASAIQQPKGPRLLRITDIQDGNVNWDAVPYCTIDRDAIDRYTTKDRGYRIRPDWRNNWQELLDPNLPGCCFRIVPYSSSCPSID